MAEALRNRPSNPGGLLVIEGFHRDATRDRTIGGAVVLIPRLPALFRQLRVVRYEEPVTDADFGLGKSAPGAVLRRAAGVARSAGSRLSC